MLRHSTFRRISRRIGSTTGIPSRTVPLRSNAAMRLAVLASLAATLWGKAPDATFARDVAPILYRHCAVCHHAGAVAPFSLITYSDAAKRAALIARVTSQRYMPPWLPSAPHFKDER